MFIFYKNSLKPRFLGLKKDCTSQDSNPGPQHWDFENGPVGVQGLFSYNLLYNLIEEAISFRMVPWEIFSDEGKVV